MGLFSLFAGKAPEDLEAAGDDYLAVGEFGAAKVEYDKALEKAEKKSPEKQALIKRLAEKADNARESLARFHVKEAEELIQAENYQEAEDLLHLAFELTGDESLKAEIKAKAKALHPSPAEGAGSNAEFEPQDLSTAAAGENAEEEDQYFHVLVSTLPKEMQAAYETYGQTFRAGYIALNQGDFNAAVAHFTDAMNENSSPESWIPLELATAYIHLGEPESARPVLETYIQKNPESLRAYQLLCEIYWETGEYQAAAELIEKSPEPLKQTGEILMLLGETFYQAGSYEKARDVFMACGEKFGSEELITRALAKTYEAMGDFDKARGLYGEIMKGCTSCRTRIDPFIKRRFAELSFQTGDTSTPVLEMFLSLVREDPDNQQEYYQRIGKIYEATGNLSEAKRYYGFAG